MAYKISKAITKLKKFGERVTDKDILKQLVWKQHKGKTLNKEEKKTIAKLKKKYGIKNYTLGSYTGEIQFIYKI